MARKSTNLKNKSYVNSMLVHLYQTYNREPVSLLDLCCGFAVLNGQFLCTLQELSIQHHKFCCQWRGFDCHAAGWWSDDVDDMKGQSCVISCTAVTVAVCLRPSAASSSLSLYVWTWRLPKSLDRSGWLVHSVHSCWITGISLYDWIFNATCLLLPWPPSDLATVMTLFANVLFSLPVNVHIQLGKNSVHFTFLVTW